MSTDSSYLLSTATLLFAINVIQKVCSFTLNQLLLRYVSPEIIGQASIKLELFLSTLLFLSREGIRLALLREKIDTERKIRSLVNISWIPAVVLAVATASILTYQLIFKGVVIWVYLLYCVGALFESLGEPFYNIYQSKLDVVPRVRAESIALFLRSASIFLLINFKYGIDSYGIAQVMYGGSYLIILIAHYKRSNMIVRYFLPAPLLGAKSSKSSLLNSIANSDTLRESYEITRSSILKHLLTEADKIVMTFTMNDRDQGLYAITHNYGSLVARLVFLPIEETSRLTFSKLAAQWRDVRKDGAIDNLVHLTETFKKLLYLTTFIGINILIFGSAYSRVVVNLFYSQSVRSNEAVSALSFYCMYILSLGINGITEGFIQTVTPSNQLKHLNWGFVISSICFILSALVFIPFLGTNGVIVANICGMLCRTSTNCYLIHSNYSRKVYFLDAKEGSSINGMVYSPIYEMLPKRKFSLVTLFTGIIVHLSAFYYSRTSQTFVALLLHIMIGAFTGIAYILFLYKDMSEKERLALLSMIKTIKNKNV